MINDNTIGSFMHSHSTRAAHHLHSYACSSLRPSAIITLAAFPSIRATTDAREAIRSAPFEQVVIRHGGVSRFLFVDGATLCLSRGLVHSRTRCYINQLFCKIEEKRVRHSHNLIACLMQRRHAFVSWRSRINTSECTQHAAHACTVTEAVDHR
jgi:hypothetical protein